MPPVKGKPSRTCHQWSNDVTSQWFDLLLVESAKGRTFRLLLALLNLGIGGLILFAGHTIGRNIHVLFWLGGQLQTTLLVTISAIATAFLLQVRMRLVHVVRKNASGSSGAARACCEPNQNLARQLILLFATLGAVSIFLGLRVGFQGEKIAEQLTSRCRDKGASKASWALEDTRLQLEKFDQQCQTVEDETAGMPVDECPGFKEAFPPPSPYVTYLAGLELKESCSGWCSKKPPLFAKSEAKEQGKACSIHISDMVQQAAWGVGAPCAGLGGALLICAVFLLDYDAI